MTPPETRVTGSSVRPFPAAAPRAGVSFAARLAFDGIAHDYAGKPTLCGISLAAEAGEILCLLGPSGSGKTTLLRIAAGIETQSRGRVLLNDREIAGPSVFMPPERRGIGLMFQDFALFPHLTILENVRFGLAALPSAEAGRAAMMALERVALAGHAKAYPHQLSGGEQQRVALARALAPRPSVLLMDEPFSGLDQRLKETVRDQTLAILRETRTTAVIVTHDPEEAMRMGDRIALMREGRLVQVGTPQDLYYRPVDLFAAGFFSELNLFDGHLERGTVATPLGPFAAPHLSDLPDGTPVVVAVRPAFLDVWPAGSEEGRPGVPARIAERRFLGGDELLLLEIVGAEASARARIRAGRLMSGLREVVVSANDRGIMVFERASRTSYIKGTGTITGEE